MPCFAAKIARPFPTAIAPSHPRPHERQARPTTMARQQNSNRAPGSPLRPLPSLIFASRWLQLPLYLGLIAAQGVYVWHFLLELWHLIEAAFGNQEALQALITSIGYKHDAPIGALNETIIMLVVLALIDVVMISNLLIMVIVGGYETFVSRLEIGRASCRERV